MKEPKTTINIKSLLSTIDKLNNSIFQNNSKIKKPSKTNKLYQNEYSTNTNNQKKENIIEFNNFFSHNSNSNNINNNNDYNNYINNKISLTKNNNKNNL